MYIPSSARKGAHKQWYRSWKKNNRKKSAAQCWGSNA